MTGTARTMTAIARDLLAALPLRAGDGHYYRLQAPGLLIEYDNTQRNANHAHTVLRRPGRDFGGSPLASHLAAGHS